MAPKQTQLQRLSARQSTKVSAGKAVLSAMTFRKYAYRYV